MRERVRWLCFEFGFKTISGWSLCAGQTALHKAAENGGEEIVTILLEHGSDIDFQDQVFDFLFLLFKFVFPLFLFPSLFLPFSFLFCCCLLSLIVFSFCF